MRRDLNLKRRDRCVRLDPPAAEAPQAGAWCGCSSQSRAGARGWVAGHACARGGFGSWERASGSVRSALWAGLCWCKPAATNVCQHSSCSPPECVCHAACASASNFHCSFAPSFSAHPAHVALGVLQFSLPCCCLLSQPTPWPLDLCAGLLGLDELERALKEAIRASFEARTAAYDEEVGLPRFEFPVSGCIM